MHKKILVILCNHVGRGHGEYATLYWHMMNPDLSLLQSLSQFCLEQERITVLWSREEVVLEWSHSGHQIWYLTCYGYFGYLLSFIISNCHGFHGVSPALYPFLVALKDEGSAQNYNTLLWIILLNYGACIFMWLRHYDSLIGFCCAIPSLSVGSSWNIA